MATQPFEERQAFHWIIYAGLLLTLGGMFAAVLTASAVNGESLDPGQRWSTLAWIVFPCLIAVNVLFMRTRVDGHELVVQFGYCFPIYRKRIPLQEIRRARVVEYRPIRDAGGWGIRFGRFEQERCRFLNCRGNRGVLLETARLRCIVGSQQPERHLAAVKPGAAPSGMSG